MSTINHLDQLGYSSFFEEGRRALGWGDVSVARVISESRGMYRVKNAEGEYTATITGKRMFDASSREDYPAVGDWVAIEMAGADRAVIRGILPRRTVLKRVYGDENKSGKKDASQLIAVNIDVAFIIMSVDRDFNLNRIERYVAIAERGGVTPAIVINKIDLCAPKERDTLSADLGKRFPDIDIIMTSTVNGDGVEVLRTYMQKDMTYCFLGSSGVGKSSLVNALLGTDTIRTGDIGTYANRGRHVTTARHLYVLVGGAIVIDNPGMREVGMAESGDVASSFEEIVRLSEGCKYADCTHTHEPGCAVLAAVAVGTLDDEQRLNYVALKKEDAYLEMEENEKREKDRRFGKFKKNALKDLGKIER
ncbi:MAG: ribosome small subunit-dependent GTPase A [Candidatus Yonathbacteria bacterium]|nr:ribosome small subunit-dependent GTPase A [Candidatus Yonathbacteria bacterium]NTW47420.1 ribosome small subunit-dependent GTPase A [Candidatus Yonathbacteria bacterium]